MTVVPLVDYARLLDVLDVEGERLAVAATGTDPDVEVPHLPGMRLGEVVRHVGSVYRMVVSWLRDGERPTRWQREPNEDQSLVDYLRSGLRELIGELAAHDPEEGCATWWQVHQNYGFWYRRMAHETTIHRVDAQLAGAGMMVGGVADDFALDGIDEILTLWFTHRLGVLGVSDVLPGTISVRAGDRQWLARVTESGTSAWRAERDEPVDATVTNDPVGMYLWLWGRWPRQRVNEFGQLAAVDQFHDLLRLATR